MNRFVLSVIIAFCVPFAHAALPPQYQNAKDLTVMVEFISEHPRIISTLQSIDFVNKRVYFAGNCEATFGRRAKTTSEFTVGPAEPLEFKKSNCNLD